MSYQPTAQTQDYQPTQATSINNPNPPHQIRREDLVEIVNESEQVNREERGPQLGGSQPEAPGIQAMLGRMTQMVYILE